jgi:hypothetical protein
MFLSSFSMTLVMAGDLETPERWCILDGLWIARGDCGSISYNVAHHSPQTPPAIGVPGHC